MLSAHSTTRVKPMPIYGTAHAWAPAGSFQQLPTNTPS
jgi:hypothetical protein